jgi:hypothetical protein
MIQTLGLECASDRALPAASGAGMTGALAKRSRNVRK